MHTRNPIRDLPQTFQRAQVCSKKASGCAQVSSAVDTIYSVENITTRLGVNISGIDCDDATVVGEASRTFSACQPEGFTLAERHNYSILPCRSAQTKGEVNQSGLVVGHLIVSHVVSLTEHC